MKTRKRVFSLAFVLLITISFSFSDMVAKAAAIESYQLNILHSQKVFDSYAPNDLKVDSQGKFMALKYQFASNYYLIVYPIPDSTQASVVPILNLSISSDTNLAFSNNGSRLAIIETTANRVRLFDLPNTTPVWSKTFQSPLVYSTRIFVADDSKFMFVQYNGSQYLLTLVNSGNGDVIFEHPIAASFGLDLQFDRNDDFYYIHGNQTLEKYSINRELLWRTSDINNGVYLLVARNSSLVLVRGAADQLAVLNAQNGSTIYAKNHSASVRGYAVNHQGESFAVGLMDGSSMKVVLMNSSSPSPVKEVTGLPLGLLREVCNDLSYVAVLPIGGFSSSIILVDMNAGSVIFNRTFDTTNSYERTGYSYSSNKIAVAYSSGTIVFMEVIRPSTPPPVIPKSTWDKLVDLFSNTDNWLGLGLVALAGALIGGLLVGLIMKKKK